MFIGLDSPMKTSSVYHQQKPTRELLELTVALNWRRAPESRTGIGWIMAMGFSSGKLSCNLKRKSSWKY